MATIRKTPSATWKAVIRKLKKALQRYETEVVPTKRPSTQRREKPASANLKAKLGDYSLAAITPDIVAGYRDQRLAEAGCPRTKSRRCCGPATSTPIRCSATLTETKNGSARTVPLSNAAVGMLRTALVNPVRPIDTDLVFFGEPGRDGVRRPYEFRPQWGRTPDRRP